MEFLQKFPYIFSTFLPMAAFFALGIWIAWYVWYRHAKALNAAYAANGKIVNEFEALRTRQHALSVRAIALAGRGGEWRQKFEKRDADFVSLKGNFDGAKGEADKLKNQLNAKEKDFGVLNLKLKDLGAEKDNEIKGMVTQLSGFKSDLSGRDGELKKLRAEIGSAGDAKSKLEADLGKRDAELKKLRAEIGSFGDAKSKLEADLGKRDAELDKLRADVNAAGKVKSKLEADLGNRDGELNKLRGEVKAAGDAKSKLEADLKNRDGELNKLRGEVKAAGDAKAKLEADLKNRDGELNKLRGEVKAAGDAKAKLEADLKNRDGELNKLRGEVKAAGDAKAKLEADLKNRDGELNKLRGEVKAAGDAKSKLEADLKNRDGELNKLRGDVKAAGEAKAKLEADLGRRDADLDKLRAEIEAKKKAAAALEAQAAKLDNELKDHRNQLAGAKKTVGERDDKIIKLTNTHDGERKQWDGKVKGLTGDVSNRDTTIRDLQAKLKEAAKLEAQLAKLQASIDEREKSIANLKGQLGDKDNSLAALKDDVSYRDKQLSTSQTQLEKKESEREKLAAELEKWRNRANDTSKQDALATEIQGLKSSVKKSEAELAEERDKAARAASGLSLFDGEDVSEDKDLGLVYKKKPDTVDDLKRISGVGGVLEGKLHEFGVYRFKQIALWDQKRLETFSDRLDFKGRVEREMWVHQACDFHNADYGERLRPMTDIYRQPMTRTVKGSDPAAIDAAFEGENVTRDEDLGVVYKKRPDEIDDLKEISGVAGVLEGKLHEFGIYRFKQVALWQRDQIDTFSERLNFPDRIDRDMWVHQAVDLHFEKHDEHLNPQVPIYRKPEVRTRTSTVIKMDNAEPAGPSGFVGEAVTEDPKLGVVYTSRPDKVDDLKRIKGVANVLEAKLHGFGVYRFKQIAMWSPEIIAEFSERLAFRDRVERDNWKAQAAKFHQEEYGEKVASGPSLAQHDLVSAN